MRQIITLFAVLFASISFAQIQVSQVHTKAEEHVVGSLKPAGYFHSELTYRIEDKDTIYTLMYRNAKYSQIRDYKSLKFSGEDNTLNQLYDVIKSVFSDENKKNKDFKVELKLGETQVIISNFKTMGITSAMFFTSDGYFYLTEKQLDKLFGKV
jgi:hypothetical protein